MRSFTIKNEINSIFERHQSKLLDQFMTSKIWDTPIKAIIFDNDGTLMDTEWAYEWAFEQITGQKESLEMKAKLMGKAALESCSILIDFANLNETPEHLSDRRTKLLEQCWKSVKLLPGADWIVSEFKKKGIPMVIATSSRRHVFEQKSFNHKDFISNMNYIVCGNEVSRSKPNPDIFLYALGKFENVKPEEALVFEDSPLGIKAANRAGIPSVFIPDPNLDGESLLKIEDAKPILTLKSLQDFDFSQFIWAI